MVIINIILNERKIKFILDSPKRCLLIHWLTGLMALVGVIMVLVAHGHYTVDVLIAYYVTTRLWYIYHTLANNINLKVRNVFKHLKILTLKLNGILICLFNGGLHEYKIHSIKKETNEASFFLLQQHGPNNSLSRLWWFPLFKYFEKNIGGPVPRQYDWPLPWRRRFLTKHPNRDS